MENKGKFSRRYQEKLDNNSYRILQWNTQGITAKQDILILKEMFESSIVVFQETFLANEYQIKLRNYQGIAKQGTFNRRHHGGVITYIHESFPF